MSLMGSAASSIDSETDEPVAAPEASEPKTSSDSASSTEIESPASPPADTTPSAKRKSPNAPRKAKPATRLRRGERGDAENEFSSVPQLADFVLSRFTAHVKQPVNVNVCYESDGSRTDLVFLPPSRLSDDSPEKILDDVTNRIDKVVSEATQWKRVLGTRHDVHLAVLRSARV